LMLRRRGKENGSEARGIIEESRMFISVLFGFASWRVLAVLVLTLVITLTQGVQLLLLVPMMNFAGLDVQQGGTGMLSKAASAVFGVMGVRPTLVPVLAAYVILTTLQALVSRQQAISSLRLEQDFVSSLRRRLYRAVADVDWLTFVRSRPSDFTHALTTELDRVGGALQSMLAVASSCLVLSIYVLFALRLSVEMTVMVFFCGILLMVLLRRKTKEARWSGEDISLATNGLYAATTEHLGAMKTTKSYGAELRNTELFSGLAEQVARMRLDAVRIYSAAGFWFQVLSVLALSIILYLAFEVISLPAAGLLLLLFIFTRVVPLFAGVQQGIQHYLNNLPAFSGVMRKVALCEDAAEPVLPESREVGLDQRIRFENVSFSYEEGEDETLRGLSLTIEAGRTTALVGPSGAGKSTLADLVMRLISPRRGDILVDGVSLREIDARLWRRRIGYVAQDTFLFNDTVRANLLWACPEAGEDEMWRALRDAAADGFVAALPRGLDTVLGDRGIRLSGGERQRLALARALLRRPRLLILDEATSALDSENERQIQRAIERLHGETTILLITHRLSTARNADVIHVLDDGSLVQSGEWKALLEDDNGRFRALCAAQGISGAADAVAGPV